MKQISVYILMAIFFTNCSTAQKLQNTAPVSFGEVYSQKWVAGVKGGGSGINLFIPVSEEIPENIHMDSVYFRGKVAKLERVTGENPMFVGRFVTEFNQKADITMSSDPKEEYGNQALKLDKKSHFDLKDSECVISYQDGSDTKYFKIENITDQKVELFPSAPQNKQE